VLLLWLLLLWLLLWLLLLRRRLHFAPRQTWRRAEGAAGRRVSAGFWVGHNVIRIHVQSCSLVRAGRTDVKTVAVDQLSAQVAVTPTPPVAHITVHTPACYSALPMYKITHMPATAAVTSECTLHSAFALLNWHARAGPVITLPPRALAA
jgi:hypothetical protein